MASQNVYEYEKIKTLDKFSCVNSGFDEKMDCDYINLMRNKINQLVIEYNKIAKDITLYKKAYKDLYYFSKNFIIRT